MRDRATLCTPVGRSSTHTLLFSSLAEEVVESDSQAPRIVASHLSFAWRVSLEICDHHSCVVSADPQSTRHEPLVRMSAMTAAYYSMDVQLYCGSP